MAVKIFSFRWQFTVIHNCSNYMETCPALALFLFITFGNGGTGDVQVECLRVEPLSQSGVAVRMFSHLSFS